VVRSSVLDKTAGYVLIAALILMPVVSHAGGLGVAPLVFILGILGLVLHLKSRETKPLYSSTFLILALFLIWLCTTSIWSPYRPDDLLTNYIKLLIMGLIFYFCPVVFKQAANTNRMRLQRVFLIMMVLSAFLVMIDTWAKFQLTLLFNPPSHPEELGSRLKDAEMNLGHAITVLVLLSAPVTVLLKVQTKLWKILSFLFFVMIAIASFSNDLSIGIVGILIVIPTMVLSFKRPHATLSIVISLAALSIIFAPLWALIANQVVQQDLSQIPLSWEHRLQTWAYCWPVILENPFIGSGFDAVRTFDDQWMARTGHKLSVMPLHPHNAGIHIWVEAGFVGCILAASLILSCLKPLLRLSDTRDKAALISGVIIAALLMSSTTYGAFQFWWWGAVFFAISFIHLMSDHNTSSLISNPL